MLFPSRVYPAYKYSVQLQWRHPVYPWKRQKVGTEFQLISFFAQPQKDISALDLASLVTGELRSTIDPVKNYMKLKNSF